MRRAVEIDLAAALLNGVAMRAALACERTEHAAHAAVTDNGMLANAGVARHEPPDTPPPRR